MADINVERRGPSIWPWIVGLLVLALLIWAIAEMVGTDDEVQEVAETEQVEEPAAAVPSPEPAQPDVADIATLMPLGSEDVGMRGRLRGTVVGQPTEEGFWVRTGDDHAIFVRSDRTVQAGQQIDEVVGVIESAPEAGGAEWIERANLREEEGFEQWTVHTDVFLDATAEGEAQPEEPPVVPDDKTGTQDGDGENQPGS